MAPAYLFILVGSHCYELGLWEGAVHHHPVGASHANYVYLGLVFVQGVQHYLQETKQRDSPQCHSGTSQPPSGSVTEPPQPAIVGAGGQGPSSPAITTELNRTRLHWTVFKALDAAASVNICDSNCGPQTTGLPLH